ncbi:TetR/AcrR family transcriptional regulator [Cupriavidus pinatubonensis]|uniref:TetR/AcrR family transcriptional regulator n=1 Tax=Cupriavidus pinatubonensis TaxID=248026 RepID=UPI001C636C48|nr:TetR/AcrR family transcriptional regulator [Cupriavidus pinatubonensis]
MESGARRVWRRGYEPTSIADLCTAMAINPPSLYAAFGKKAKLFLEAVSHYEAVYWDDAWKRMHDEPDMHEAIRAFFSESAAILSSPGAPCGCLVVLAAINVSPDSREVIEALTRLRQEGKDHFLRRLARGIDDRHLPANTDIDALGGALNSLLEGMSIPARDGASHAELKGIAMMASGMIPAKPKTSRKH